MAKGIPLDANGGVRNKDVQHVQRNDYPWPVMTWCREIDALVMGYGTPPDHGRTRRLTDMTGLTDMTL